MIFAKGITEDLGLSIISLIKWTDFLLLIDLPFILYATIKSDRARAKKSQIRFSCFLFGITTLAICFLFSQFEKNPEQSSYRMQTLRLSPVGVHIYDFYRVYTDKNKTLDATELSKVNDWIKQNKKYQPADEKYASLKGILQGKNLIIVQVESLENIVIGQSYGGQEITPNINKLLKNSIYFNNIHEQVNDGNSSDAELLFNTSLYPIDRGSAFLRFGDNTYESLPLLLKDYGYNSIAIHGDNKEFWNRDRVFKSIGFDNYVSEEQFQYTDKGGMGILDKDLFSQSLLEIDKIKEPFNIFIITLTSHIPFNISNNLRYMNLSGNDYTTNYLQSIHYTDLAIGEFYNNLKQKGYLNNSVLIIYGDHEGVHKYYETTLPDNYKEIPFIIYMPGMEETIIKTIGGQVDMMPTIAYLLGIDETKYESEIMGRNLFRKGEGSALLANGEIVGQEEDIKHLTTSHDISDIIIKGNYLEYIFNNGIAGTK
ncbi:MAG: LTA synthase family protein [Clostridiaceae bacterium]